MNKSMRWSVTQRLDFIEQRLFWEGCFRKADLAKKFSISTPQASADVALYLQELPGAMRYNPKKRAFVADRNFEPKFSEPDSGRYLMQLLLLADNAIEPSDSWLGNVPMSAAIPRVRRRVDVRCLRAIVRAIHQHDAVSISYQSMSSIEPKTRWIAPHALAFDGRRWHTRAWCYNRSMFVDFVLARILDVFDSRSSDVQSTLDRAWNENVTIELKPHPDLSDSQRRAIELDYGMEEGAIGVTMRLCLSGYFEKHWYLDQEDLPAVRKQVVWSNREEVYQLRRLCGLPNNEAARI